MERFYNYSGDYAASYEALVYELYWYMQPYQNLFFMDEALETLVMQFIDGLWMEYDNMDAYGNTLDQTVMYESYAMQYKVVGALAAAYGLFSNNTELYDACVGHGDYYEDIAFVLKDLYSQINEQELKKDAANGQYLEYTNNSDRIINLQYYFELTNNGYFVANGQTSTVVVNPGETVKLWLNEPQYCPSWNRWTFYRGFDFLN
jgi:hypothetical protein